MNKYLLEYLGNNNKFKNNIKKRKEIIIYLINYISEKLILKSELLEEISTSLISNYKNNLNYNLIFNKIIINDKKYFYENIENDEIIYALIEIIKLLKNKKKKQVSLVGSFSIENPPIKIPETGSIQIPETGSIQIPETGSIQIPETGYSKIPETGYSKIPETGYSKIPETGYIKIPETGSMGSMDTIFDIYDELHDTKSEEISYTYVIADTLVSKILNKFKDKINLLTLEQISLLSKINFKNLITDELKKLIIILITKEKIYKDKDKIIEILNEFDLKKISNEKKKNILNFIIFTLSADLNYEEFENLLKKYLNILKKNEKYLELLKYF